MEKLLVKARPGEKCPMEGKPKEYITDDEKGASVDDTAYYRRLIDDGSLIVVTGSGSPVPGPQATERSKK